MDCFLFLIFIFPFLFYSLSFPRYLSIVLFWFLSNIDKGKFFKLLLLSWVRLDKPVIVVCGAYLEIKNARVDENYSITKWWRFTRLQNMWLVQKSVKRPLWQFLWHEIRCGQQSTVLLKLRAMLRTKSAEKVVTLFLLIW